MAAKAGRLQIQLEMQVAALQRDLDKATRAIEQSASKWQDTFKGTFASDFARDFVNKVSGAITQVIDDMGRIADESQKLGDSAEMYQRLAFAAEQTGVSMDTVVAASGRVQKALGANGKAAADAAKLAGVSIEELRRMTTGEAFTKVAGGLGLVKDSYLQAALGAEIFGKSWQSLLPLISQGEAGIKRMADQANVASDAAVKAGDDFGDMVSKGQGAVKTFIAEALAPLLPVLTQAIERMTNTGTAAENMGKGFDKSKSSAQSLGETMAFLFKALNASRENFATVRDMAASTITGLFKGLQVKDLTQQMEEFGNSWSRVANNFSEVTAKIGFTSAELVDPQKAAADAAAAAAAAYEEQQKAAAGAADAARKKAAADKAAAEAEREKEKAAREALKAEVALAKQLDDVQERVNQKWARTEGLLEDRAVAQAEWMGMSRDELEILELQLQGYDEKQLAIAREAQAYRNATAARKDDMDRMQEERQRLADVTVHGFADIFMSMTEGADQAKEAVARLVIELAAMYLQMVAMKALQQTGGATVGGLGTGGLFGAKGLAFDHAGLIPFAMGGIVRSPTAFTFGGGRAGVMGEAGPEAIMPLGRDSAGRLGVRGGGVNVNIHNNNGSQISVERSGDDINVIVDKVTGIMASKIARGGNVLATSLEGAYGLRR